MDLTNISLILLAVAITSKEEPSSKAAIIDTYDYINKDIPTDEDYNETISWLLNKGLIDVVDEKYALSEKGKEIYVKSTKTSKNDLHSIRKEIENELKR